MQLLSGAGLRRSELCALALVDERRRAADGTLRRAVSDSTAWWTTVRDAKCGRTRKIPLPRPALEAVSAWVRARPSSEHELLFCSLPRTGRPPGPLSTWVKTARGGEGFAAKRHVAADDVADRPVVGLPR